MNELIELLIEIATQGAGKDILDEFKLKSKDIPKELYSKLFLEV